MIDSRTAWKGRKFAADHTTARFATNTAPAVSRVVIGAGRTSKPKGWWGPPTHPGHGCTVVAGWGIDHHVPPTAVPADVQANDGASRGKRRLAKVRTISEMTGVRSTLTSAQSARIRDFC